ncbi:major membrane immunogen (membrane-anchored lipoprotein) [Filimonas zeae]|uniref:DUF4374 domain-containing protein n=1 Tax=Filimonas zeae TaxID=1737353 RepID=A0A917J3T6_9BACT|nr:hypothetical protein [Filimonas zeae]MDR6342799.1 major membrane immunogen (membrane-anchored lipoprotein) [Filimonas zeae]GGH82753.1 hypothetical protein GCM10011379_57110 [Filimonas zeae]
MKRLFKTISGLACLLLLNACSKNDGGTTPTTNKGSFNLWVQVGSWPNANYYVLGLNNLTTDTVTLSGNGVDVTSILNNSVISRGGYYYYYNTTEGRFGKYQLVNGAVSSVKQVPFTNLTSLAGHTWINDSTLVMVGAFNGGKNVNYSTVNVNSMTITNGTFTGLPAIPTGYTTYRVGGDIQYVNGNLFFGITYINGSFVAYPGHVMVQASYPGFTVGTTTAESRTSGLGNTSGYFATSFVDKNKDMYYLTSWVSKWADGTANAPIYIYRIKNGQTKPDDAYHVKVTDILSREAASGLFMDLGNGNAILKYIETTVNNESTYGYAIINLANGTQVRKLTEVPFGGSGERNVLVEDGKAYIAVLSGTAKDYIWVYDAATDKVTRGTQIQGGYNSFSRLDKMN